MPLKKAEKNKASIDWQRVGEGELRLTLAGRLNSDNTGPFWLEVQRKLDESIPSLLVIDAGNLEYADAAGIALLLALTRRQEREGNEFRIEGLREDFSRLMQMQDPGEISRPSIPSRSFTRMAEDVGKGTVSGLLDIREGISFLGEVTAAVVSATLRPFRIRWKDIFQTVEKAGVNCVGLIALVGFGIGIIMTFQSAVQFVQYGTEIYAAGLTAIILFREIGPLIVGFLLAARTGSAFAAELGTMKVNEEIDAMKTMGLDPVRFLVVPRVLAAAFVTPVLTIVCILFGLVATAVVMLTFGYPLISVTEEFQSWVGLKHVAFGMIKTPVFGLLIGGVGCLRGLQTKTGPSAVGDSATRAAVSGIVLIAIADGLFSVIDYFLEI